MKVAQKLFMRSVLAGVVSGLSYVPIANAAGAALEEVVVNARKKDEIIQDVPLAVSAVSKDVLESAFMGNSTGITQFAPNIVFDEISAGTPSGGGISIRGISFQDVEKTFDPAVLVYVDDIALGSNTGNVMNMLDVQSIEVLRGPQGTLFGKNAVGGVISIHRTKPILGEWAGKLRARAGNYERRDLEGVINVPIGETLAAKINVAQLEQNQGFYKNVTTGHDDGDSREKQFGIHFLWQPIDSLTAELQYNQSNTDGTSAPMLNINSNQALFCAAFGACAQGPHTPSSGDRREGAGELRPDFYLDTSDYTANVNWEIDSSWTAVAIYGHREIKDKQNTDFDSTPIHLFNVLRSSEYQQDSLETRIDYDAGENLSFTAGYYYWDAQTSNWKNELEIPLLLGLPPNGCGPSVGAISCEVQSADAESKSNSVFFEGDYRLTDELVATLGARWIKEHKDISKSDVLPVFGVVALPLTSASRTDSDIIYRAGLRYEFTPDLMTYLSYSTGFRSGGFSIRAQTAPVLTQGFKPETVKNLEAGLKTTVWDNRLRMNVAVFNMKYDDMQQELNIPGGPSGQQDTVVNAASATIRGVELEANAAVTDSIRIDFNAGYLDAQYDKFIGSIYADGVTRDLSNLPLRRAPKWNYTLAFNYTAPIGEGQLLSRIGYNWRDDYAGTATDFPGTHLAAFGVLDASAAYKIKQWQVALFGRNLTNADQYNHTFAVAPGFDGSSLFTFASPRAPRTYGVELTYTFGNY